MRIDNILIGPATRDGVKCNVLHMEVSGYKFTGYFLDQMDSYLSCMQEAVQFFALKTGKLKQGQQTLTRPVLNA